MATNWKLIRELTNAAIDACEKAESLKISDREQSASIRVGERDVTAWDFLQSSWRYPENLRDCLVRARSKLGEDRKFVDELQRTLIAVGNVSSELIGLENTAECVKGVDPYNPNDSKSVEQLVQGLIEFYTKHMIPSLPKALESARNKAV
jgi:hypothetical protein